MHLLVMITIVKVQLVKYQQECRFYPNDVLWDGQGCAMV